MRPDKGDPGRRAGRGEFGILRQKAVSRMDRIGPAVTRCIEDRIDVQITVLCWWRPDWPSLVREVDMQCRAIGFRVDRDYGDPEPSGGADHPTGDFAAVGDQDLAEQAHIRKTPNRVARIGALRLAEIASAKVTLVSTGSIIPSSHSRALA